MTFGKSGKHVKFERVTLHLISSPFARSRSGGWYFPEASPFSIQTLRDLAGCSGRKESV